MKIVQLITALQLGGAEKVAIDISTKLDQCNFETTIITIFKDDSAFSREIKNQLSEKNIKWQEFGLRKKFTKIKYIGMLLSVVQIFVYLLRHKPDIVHSHTDLPDFVLSNVLRIFTMFNVQKPKVVRTIHNTHLWPSHKKIACFVEKAYQDDYVIFISEGAKEAYYQLRERCNLYPTINSFFIMNGIDLDHYTNKCHKDTLTANGIHLEKSKMNFLFVGRLVKQKGFDLLLEAIAKVDPILRKKMHLYVFGQGELERMLLKPEYSDFPISKFPPITNLNKLYACFDCLFMPSRFEGLGLVALEAAASRIPVIASNVSGLSEAIPDNWSLTFENEDIQSLKVIIEDVIGNKYDLTSLSDVSRNFVEKKFDLKVTVQKYINVYKNGGFKNEA